MLSQNNKLKKPHLKPNGQKELKSDQHQHQQHQQDARDQKVQYHYPQLFHFS